MGRNIEMNDDGQHKSIKEIIIRAWDYLFRKRKRLPSFTKHLFRKAKRKRLNDRMELLVLKTGHLPLEKLESVGELNRISEEKLFEGVFFDPVVNAAEKNGAVVNCQINVGNDVKVQFLAAVYLEEK